MVAIYFQPGEQADTPQATWDGPSQGILVQDELLKRARTAEGLGYWPVELVSAQVQSRENSIVPQATGDGPSQSIIKQDELLKRACLSQLLRYRTIELISI